MGFKNLRTCQWTRHLFTNTEGLPLVSLFSRARSIDADEDGPLDIYLGSPYSHPSLRISFLRGIPRSIGEAHERTKNFVILVSVG